MWLAQEGRWDGAVGFGAGAEGTGLVGREGAQECCVGSLALNACAWEGGRVALPSSCHAGWMRRSLSLVLSRGPYGNTSGGGHVCARLGAG